MNPTAKRFVLLGVGLVALVALLNSLGVFSTGLPAANPAAASPSGSTSVQAPAKSAPESPAQPDRTAQLQQRLAENPGDLAALSELASVLYQAKRYAQAADLVYQAIEIEPNNAMFRMALGQALFFQGMPSMAQAEFRRAIDLDPNNVEAHFNYALAVSHGPRADVEAAKASWQAVIRLDGDGELGRRAKEFLAQMGSGQ